jgi:hypothetical protein
MMDYVAANVSQTFTMNTQSNQDFSALVNNTVKSFSQPYTYGTDDYQINYIYHQDITFSGNSYNFNLQDLVDHDGKAFHFTSVKEIIIKYVSSTAFLGADLLVTNTDEGSPLPWGGGGDRIQRFGKMEHDAPTSGYGVVSATADITIVVDSAVPQDVRIYLFILGIGEEGAA